MTKMIICFFLYICFLIASFTSSYAAVSNLNLLPDNTDFISDTKNIYGEEASILSHSSAKLLTNGSVSLYNSALDYSNKSIYTVFDILINTSDKLTLTVRREASNGTNIILSGEADGSVTAKTFDSSGNTVDIECSMLCGKWYRALLEIPQVYNGVSVVTGNGTFSAYEIDDENPLRSLETVAYKDGLSPRNLYYYSAQVLNFKVNSGKPYIDNGIVYLSDDWYGYKSTKNPDGTLSDVSVTRVTNLLAQSNSEFNYLWSKNMVAYK